MKKILLILVAVLAILKVSGQNSSAHLDINYDDDDYNYTNDNGGSYSGYRWYMNTNYTIADTVGGNANLINYFYVAYDTIFDAINNIPYPEGSYTSLTIDSIGFIGGWVKNDTFPDTLKVSVVETDANGYPTSTVLWDTLAITVFGATIYNDLDSVGVNVFTPNIVISSPHFAVLIQWYSNKTDSFYFQAGFPVDPSNVCTGGIGAAKSDYLYKGKYANSYAYWNGQQALLPASNGHDIFYNCKGASADTFVVGDSRSFIQNINLFTAIDINFCTFNVADSIVNTQCGQSSGSINLSISGANSAVTYTWSNGDTTQNIGNLGQGVYSVTVTDTTCSQTLDFFVDNTNGPVISGTHSDITCTNTSGSITISVTGGVPPYTYLWSNGATTQNLDSLSNGTYFVTVTDNNGCGGYSSVPVLYNVSGQYYVYVEGNPSNCNQLNGSVYAYPYGGYPPFSYVWSNGQSGDSIINVATGNYTVTVTDTSGCQSVGYGYVYSQCVNYITGKVFNDTKGNCIFGAGDTPQENFYMVASGDSGYYYGITDANGNYTIEVYANGTYNISALGWGSFVCGNLQACGNTSNTITFNAVGDTSANNNFGFTGGTGFDLTIHPGWTSANPGFQKQYWVMPYNQSAAPFTGNATVTFKYDAYLDYQYSESPQPVSVDSINHIITWVTNYVPSPYYDWNNGRFICYFRVSPLTPLGYELQSDFTITPYSGDCDTTNNHFHYSDLVTGSHDPNEKDVSPSGNIGYEDSVLTYTIHFQNTGSDTTNFVIVRDTLSPYLDASTVVNLASSNNYTSFTLSGKGILKWVFSPIYLVDSATNVGASKGFVMFSVKKRKGTAPTTLINNKSSVFFDYNTPVVTNTVSSMVDYPLSVKSIITGGLSIYPNPSGGDVTVSTLSNETIKQISITNVLGQTISTKTISNGNNKTINVQLPPVSGLYFIHLKGEKNDYVGKVVRE